MHTEIKVIILDFDGVVIESNDIKTKAFKRVFDKFPSHTEEMMHFHFNNISLSRVDKFHYLAVLMGRSSDLQFKEILEKDFSDCVLENILTAPFVKGAERFLGIFKSRLPLYLASITPTSELQFILEKRNLLHYFRKVYGYPPWHKSEAIYHILQNEKLMPNNALLIGDSAGDQQAAKSTGVQFIARDSGLAFKNIPNLIFFDLDDIADYLEKSIK